MLAAGRMWKIKSQKWSQYGFMTNEKDALNMGARSSWGTGILSRSWKHFSNWVPHERGLPAPEVQWYTRGGSSTLRRGLVPTSHAIAMIMLAQKSTGTMSEMAHMSPCVKYQLARPVPLSASGSTFITRSMPWAAAMYMPPGPLRLSCHPGMVPAYEAPMIDGRMIATGRPWPSWRTISSARLLVNVYVLGRLPMSCCTVIEYEGKNK